MDQQTFTQQSLEYLHKMKKKVQRSKALAKGVTIKKRRVPKKQLDNPRELHPTKDGILRLTPDNSPLYSARQLIVLCQEQKRTNTLLAELLKVCKDGE